jgi:Ala-tRNA(Pro) deacylase
LCRQEPSERRSFPNVALALVSFCERSCRKEKIMATATWVKDMLTDQNLTYEELHHRGAYTAQEVAQQEHVTGHRVAKVVVVMADRRPVELILPASRHVQLERVRDVLGATDIRLATEEEMQKLFTDCEVGAVPPLRHWPGVELLMDESMRVVGDIVLQAGTHCDALRMCFDDWFRLAGPRVADFSAPSDSSPPFRGVDGEW